jgi:hypothetical protein
MLFYGILGNMAKNNKINLENETLRKNPPAQVWDRVRVLFLKGETPEAIAKMFPEYRISASQITKRMSLEGMTAKRKALDFRIADNAMNLIEEEKLAVNKECIRLFNTGAEAISTLLNKYNDELAQSGITKGQARATAYNIDLLMSGVTKIQKGLRVAYGMDEQGKLHEKAPEVLVIKGLDEGKI